MQNVTKEYVAVMVAVPVTMDGTSNRIVQVILVSTAHNYEKESIQRILLHCFVLRITRDPHTSWILGLWGNHKMFGSWISWTPCVVKSQNGSKDFQMFSFGSNLHHNFFLFCKISKECALIFFPKLKPWQNICSFYFKITN